MDMPAWTIEHPYKNPFKVIDFNLPAEDTYQKSLTVIRLRSSSRTTLDVNRNEQRNRITKDDGYQWVMPESSFQWKCFKSTIQLLQKRGNRVFVLVGPFNEHLLEGESLKSYKNLKIVLESWLATNNIDFYAPPVLPAELYVDASHPTSEGYVLLAQQLLENESFKDFVLNAGRD